jgi:alkanesulfonate monooxygenase SsuD/methylene tetrahydromethanopterin reductase-like flavin-dependent oxidoreductase (luciferase family)
MEWLAMPELKPMTIIYPVMPAKDEAERAALRPIGRNRELYQQAIHGASDIVRAADDMGLWGIGTIEHHFWSEGYEVAPAPGAIQAYWAAITKRINVGVVGYVLATHNPIRVAEETAVINQLARGRSFVGLARGYQSRWTNVLGQHYGTRATKSPTAAIYNVQTQIAGFSQETTGKKDLEDDARNRRIFEDHVEIMVKAWTQESFEHKSDTWQIPYPHDTGVDDWPLARAGVTQRLGAPGEVDAQGHTRRVAVCPAPWTRPHPPVFVSGSGSPDTIAFCGKHGFVPTYFTNIQSAGPLSEHFRKAAALNGRSFLPGQNQCMVRWIQIGKTKEDALNRIRNYDLDIWKNFYAAMGRRKIENDDYFGSLVSSGLFVFGSVEEVRAELLAQWRVFPAEYITLINHYAQTPKDVVIETLDTFMRQVKPALDDVIDNATREAAA